MDRIPVRCVAQQHYTLQLDQDIYEDALNHFKDAEARARAMPADQGKELAGIINKGIGLLCLTQFQKVCPTTRQEIPPRAKGLVTFVRARVEGPRLIVSMEEGGGAA